MAERKVTVVVSAQDRFSPALDAYKAKMGQAAQATRDADNANTRAAGSFAGLGVAIAGALSVQAIGRVVELANEYANLGAQVTANQRMFDALTEGMGSQEAILASLRESTGGVVDDMNLMAGASQLLRLNIVDNNQDLNALLGNIQKLKQPTESTTDAIQNFALMLSNESLLRLDSFGISSANVKQRMDELGQSFREAVMAEMDVQVERLGDAASIAETEFAKLQTRIENVQQVIGVEFNKGREFYAGIANETVDLATETVAWGDRLRENLALLYGANLGQQLFPLAPAVGYSSEQIQSAQLFMRVQDQFREGWTNAQEALSEYLRTQRETFDEASQGARNLEMFRQQFGTTPDIFLNPSNFERAYGDMQNLRDWRGGLVGDQMLFTEDEAYRARFMADQAQSVVDRLKEMQPFVESGLIQQADVDRMKAIAEQADTFADNVEKGADAYRNMTAAQALGIDAPNALRGGLADMVLESARAAGIAREQYDALSDSLAIMSGRETDFTQELSQYFTDLVASGATVEQVTAQVQLLAEALRILKERGADMGQVLQPGNLPYLTGMVNTGAAGREIVVNPGDNLYSLRDRYQGSIDDYRSLLNDNGVLLPGTYNLGGMGEFNPNATPEGIAGGFLNMRTILGGEPFGIGGMGFEGMDTTMADIATSMDTLTDSSAEMDTSMSSILDSTSGINDNLVTVQSLLETMFSKKYTLKLDAIAPDWLKALLQGGGADFAAAMASATMANGGIPPGTHPTSMSNRIVER